MRLEDLIGRQLGRYTVIALLGRGGMAAVYRARDAALQRDLALKVLYPQFSGDPSLVERFQREAIVAARLDHPGIVPIYDVGEADGLAYIAMRLLGPRSLAEVLRERGTLPLVELVSIVDQIAAALDFAHARGVVHRDIKPANILLDGLNTPAQRAVLTDFGIARSLDAPALTGTGALLGTPDYMAPEQIRGARAIDGRADVYALGVLIYRCLTGRRPFEGTTQEVLIGHLEGEPVALAALDPQLPPAVSEVVRTAMARDPAQRFATAGELARALRAAASGVTRVVPRAAPSIQNRALNDDATIRGDARPRPPVAPAMASATTRASETSVTPERRSARRAPPLVLAAMVLAVLGGGGLLLGQQFGARAGTLPGIATAAPATLIVIAPSATPSFTPSATPSFTPSAAPTRSPAPSASVAPSATASSAPSVTPSATPTATATATPTAAASATPRPTSAPTATPPPTATTTPTPTATATSTPDPPSATPSPTPSETASATATLTPTISLATCQVPLDRGFGRLWLEQAAVRERLGCPTRAEAGGEIAEQPFERGSMVYFAPTERIYTFVGAAGGTWREFPQDDLRDLPTPTPAPAPGNGRVVPVGGFGLVWGYNQGVRDALGFGVRPEAGPFSGARQPFEGGVMLWSSNGLGNGPTIYVLYRDGTFERYADANQQ